MVDSVFGFTTVIAPAVIVPAAAVVVLAAVAVVFAVVVDVVIPVGSGKIIRLQSR